MSAGSGQHPDPQIDALRTEEEHHLHHARGDVGGEYHDQQEEHIQAAERAKESELDSQKDTQPVLIIVMGVSGCGKSTLGVALAHAFGIPFVDGDNLHPQTNIDKMSAGIPLTDADRRPWLERIRAEAERTVKEQAQTHTDSQGGKLRGIVVGCSALKRSYRDILRGQYQSSESSTASPSSLPTYFIHIRGPQEALLKRMKNRKGHFMKAGMLDSQLKTLEPPEATGEPNVVVVDLEKNADEQIAQARDGLRHLELNV